MSEFPSWTLMESDPGVFTELIDRMGVRGCQVQELWDIDSYAIKRLSPVHGLIFLFKWEAARQNASTDSYNSTQGEFDTSSVYFAQQIVPNACATQAIVSILLNSPEIELGEELSTFKSFTSEFPSDLKGEMIGNSELLRTAHNSFTSPDSFISERLSERSKGGNADDLFHFISFLPIDGQLYELDGLKPSPQRITDCTQDDWIEKAVLHIQQKINSYDAGELRFSLMAVTGDRLLSLQSQIDTLQSHLSDFYNPEVSSPYPQEEITMMELQLTDLRDQLDTETRQRTKWKRENSLRRHNFLPLFLQLITEASRSGRLGPMLTDATTKPSKQ